MLLCVIGILAKVIDNLYHVHFWFAPHPAICSSLPGVRICQQDLKRLQDSIGKLRVLRTELRSELWDDAWLESRLMELWDERCKLRQEQRKLREKEETLVQQRNAFYNEYEIPLPEEKPNNNSPGANEDPSSNYNGDSDNDDDSSCYSSDCCGYNGVSDNDGSSSGYSAYCVNNDQYQPHLCDGGSSGYSDYGWNNDQNQTRLCDSGEQYPHEHDKNQTGRGHDHCNNGDGHLGEIEPTDVDGHAYHSVLDDAGIQDWVHIDISGPNSVAGAQDWVYIDSSGPNNHTNGA